MARTNRKANGAKENIRRYKNGVEILPSEYTKEELKQKKLMK